MFQIKSIQSVKWPSDILLGYLIQYNILTNLQFILLQTGSEILQNDIASKMMYLSLAAMKGVPWQLVLRGIS
jgi:hypothetical protein